MRKALFIMIAMFLSFNVAAIAESPTMEKDVEATLHKTENKNNRPRTLIPDSIVCCYSYGVLFFDSDVEMTNLCVVVTRLEDNTSYVYYLNSSYDCINTQLESGEYYIAVSGDLSNYEGSLTIY